MELTIPRQTRHAFDKEFAAFWLKLWWSTRQRNSWHGQEELPSAVLDALEASFVETVSLRLVACAGLISIHDLTSLLNKAISPDLREYETSMRRIMTYAIICFDHDFTLPKQTPWQSFARWITVVTQIALRSCVLPAALFNLPGGTDLMLREFYGRELYERKHLLIMKQLSYHIEDFDTQTASRELEANMRRIFSQ